MTALYNSSTAPYGIMLADGVNKLREVQAIFRRIKAKADGLAGQVGGAANLEGTEFLAPASQGAALYANIGSVNAELQALTDSFIVALDNGGLFGS